MGKEPTYAQRQPMTHISVHIREPVIHKLQNQGWRINLSLLSPQVSEGQYVTLRLVPQRPRTTKLPHQKHRVEKNGKE